MKLSRRTTVAVAVAGAASIALLASGCSQAAATRPAATSPSTLTITTFGTIGYDDLYEEYEDENPNITIEATNLDTGGNARTDAYAKIAAGTGLSDVVAIEEGWLGTIMEVSDSFVDLRDYGIEDRKDRLARLEVRAGHRRRRPRHRLRPRHRPRRASATTATSSRRPACRATARTSPSSSAATTRPGTRFFEVGKQYDDATGKAFYDQLRLRLELLREPAAKRATTRRTARR